MCADRRTLDRCQTGKQELGVGRSAFARGRQMPVVDAELEGVLAFCVGQPVGDIIETLLVVDSLAPEDCCVASEGKVCRDERVRCRLASKDVREGRDDSSAHREGAAACAHMLEGIASCHFIGEVRADHPTRTEDGLLRGVGGGTHIVGAAEACVRRRSMLVSSVDRNSVCKVVIDTQACGIDIVHLVVGGGVGPELVCLCGPIRQGKVV